MLYFGYGSNCDPETLASYLRSHHVDPAEITDARRAVLSGYRLRTNYRTCSKWGAANLEPCAGSTTEGVLMQITPSVHRVLRQKEGWPHRYRETYVVVRVPSRRKWVIAMTYCVSDRFRLPTDIPVHPTYREQILRAASRFNFSQNYQRSLRQLLRTA